MKQACVIVSLLMLSGVAGCAPGNTSATNAAVTAASQAKVSTGTILSMRAVKVSNNSAAWRAGLISEARATTLAPDDTQPRMEFIVREDGGATISVVQSNELGLHPGDRVAIQRDNETRLTHPT